MNTLQLVKYLYMQLHKAISKNVGYKISADISLPLKVKREAHDILMELTEKGFLDFEVESDDDLFYVRKLPSYKDILQATNEAESELVASHYYDSHYDRYDEKVSLSSKIITESKVLTERLEGAGKIEPYYTIDTGQTGGLFTLRYNYSELNNYSGEWEIRSRHVLTLTGDLETSKEKAKKAIPPDADLRVIATSVRKITRNEIDHTVMPFGKHQGKHFNEIPVNDLVRTVNGGYLNGTKYVKEKANAVEALKAAGCELSTTIINQEVLDELQQALSLSHEEQRRKYGHEWNENEYPSFEEWFKEWKGASAPEVYETWLTPGQVAYEKQKEQNRLDREKQKASSNYIGNVGEKIKVRAKYVFSKSFETAFGSSRIWKFVDENGNSITYFGTSSNLYNLAQGDTIELEATVKKHDEYQGEKSTQIIRPKATRIS